MFGGMKLEIDWIKGKKANEDRLYLITTRGKESITIFRLALLTNQLAINEVEIKPWLDITKEHLYFEDLIRAAIQDAKNGVNWAEPENETHVIGLCENYHLPNEKIDYDLLRKTQQRKLEEFGRRPAP